MKVKKTIQGGAVNLTGIKERQLNQEYDNLQKFLHGDDDVNLYSANKQQAKRYYRKIEDEKEYPISIRKDLIDVQKCESDVCDYFVKIPVVERYGGLKIPINTHAQIQNDWEICESKLFRRNGRFFINITVKIEVEKIQEYKGVLGIDLGLRNPVVMSVASPSQSEVMFRGEGIKRTQARYFYLRRQSKTGKSWHRREHNKVRDELHKITTEIADYAKENKLIVAVGDLSGIQKQNKGRKMNRKLHCFPHYSLRKLLKYKCSERGVEYVEVPEAHTSQTCFRCGEIGDRKRGLFLCKNCGLELNADVNGARNIACRALSKPKIRPLVRAGAPVAVPELRNNEATSGAFSGDKLISGGEPLALTGSSFLTNWVGKDVTFNYHLVVA